MNAAKPVDHDEGTPRPNRLLRITQVIDQAGMGKSWIYDEIAAGRFPSPLHIGGSTRWSEREIQAWITAKLASRPGGA